MSEKTIGQRLAENFVLILLVFVAYALIAQIVFSFRHPWMTDTERLLNFHKALLFQRVEYQEARPRD